MKDRNTNGSRSNFSISQELICNSVDEYISVERLFTNHGWSVNCEKQNDEIVALIYRRFDKLEDMIFYGDQIHILLKIRRKGELRYGNTKSKLYSTKCALAVDYA